MHYTNPIGCYLCTRRPLSPSEIKPEFFKNISKADPPYATWADYWGVDSQFLEDMISRGLDPANGGDPTKWQHAELPKEGLPDFILQKWEKRRGIPCACFGTAQGAGPQNSTGCEATIWMMTSLDCRRTFDGVVDPELHCSDGGMTFNANVVSPLPRDIFVPPPAGGPPADGGVSPEPVSSIVNGPTTSGGSAATPAATSTPSSVEAGAGVIGTSGGSTATAVLPDLGNGVSSPPTLVPGSTAPTSGVDGNPLNVSPAQEGSPSPLFQPPPGTQPTPSPKSTQQDTNSAHKPIVGSFSMGIALTMWWNFS